jgi:C_GCAxxG_C_C family probable redox protein
MTVKERADKAVALKMSGQYNCSQAVTIALADQTSLSEEQLSQISAGFCAGMGNLEATCGALIGAGMIAGLRTEGQGTLGITKQIQEEFGRRCGSIKCKELKTITDGKPLCPCEECVRNAVMIYGEVLGIGE